LALWTLVVACVLVVFQFDDLMIVGDEAHHQGLHGHESRLALLPVAVAGHAFICPLDLPIDYMVCVLQASER
jgi:uncharacterized Zn-binding protein involved in type VI secretion